ncbi:hypothetical protein BU24DRAFT_384313 [Aaosphaeria arxii CBS 175.79]|uniref:Alpha/beta-hydrolase n=1 Tax=Aaosphaeria arxii CBS 175.79 TaxID=1450172 RepID=A0A6A5YB86_9PLEO|nr:uncharacterized protein BU24DRAFT_384313 [Aaosphaeria arxii CBS 175.79]KAF2021961.1 hypothetical protein BU24DRAFT_384313 [Aaosphaeria arxii CBS 175.79]
MHHAPEPHYSFTIPSIHDDTPLDCRIYHPSILLQVHSGATEDHKRWRRRGIVMAHPYAPMGGSHDDRIVGIVVAEFLALGYVVGTFNFRGAHGSKGHTSWSGKPEADDYISFAALFILYLSQLRAFPSIDANTPTESSVSTPASPRTEASSYTTDEYPIVILGGYSYGSTILRSLPPIPSILQPFHAPVQGSSASEIILRAHKLSEQINQDWLTLARDYHYRRGRGHEAKLSVTMGGEETCPEQRRNSRENRSSVDGTGRLELGTRLRSMSHLRVKEALGPIAKATTANAPVTRASIEMPDVRYLLISPLTFPISTLAAPGLAGLPNMGLKFWSKEKDGDSEVFGKHKCLAVNGDQDIFTSAKKIQHWAERISEESGSDFTHVEIAGAGHFWVEEGVEEQLRSALRDWEVHIRD